MSVEVTRPVRDTRRGRTPIKFGIPEILTPRPQLLPFPLTKDVYHTRLPLVCHTDTVLSSVPALPKWNDVRAARWAMGGRRCAAGDVGVEPANIPHTDWPGSKLSYSERRVPNRRFLGSRMPS